MDRGEGGIDGSMDVERMARQTGLWDNGLEQMDEGGDGMGLRALVVGDPIR